MVKRTTRRGSRAGSEFWGCSNYPVCSDTRGLDHLDHLAIHSTRAQDKF
jgi:ssDNA-binding Zn-finger/Zn-ribbon topoisomerase 1